MNNKRRLQAILIELFAPPDFNVSFEELSLRDDIGVDSFGFIELGMQLEEEFEGDFYDQDWSQIQTVGDLLGLIENQN